NLSVLCIGKHHRCGGKTIRRGTCRCQHTRTSYVVSRHLQRAQSVRIQNVKKGDLISLLTLNSPVLQVISTCSNGLINQADNRKCMSGVVIFQTANENGPRPFFRVLTRCPKFSSPFY